AGDLPVATFGGDLAGELRVRDTLGTLTVGGATTGTIAAGDIGAIGVVHGRGPVVLRIVEGGITRRLEAALPGNPYPSPSDAFPAGVGFQYFYDSRAEAGIGDPQLSVRVTNGSGTAFDLSLAVY